MIEVLIIFLGGFLVGVPTGIGILAAYNLLDKWQNEKIGH